MKAILGHPLFRFFASLKLAVMCLLTLAAVLAVATVCESLFGTRAVYIMVYGTAWFAGLLTLLGTNVFCAAAVRYPWKRHQTGFVVTHAGILTILFGSMLTQQFGVDGNLPVTEGQQGNEVLMGELTLAVIDGSGAGSRDFRFPETAMRRDGRQFEVQLGSRKRLVVDSFLPRATVERRFRASPVAGLGMPAIRVELFNSRFRVEEWLHPTSPYEPQEMNLGPALLTFRKLWSAAEEKRWLSDEETKLREAGAKHGVVVAEYNGREIRVGVSEAEKEWRPLETTGFQVKIDRYLPYAIVKDGKLVNKAPEPVNPAVQLRLRGPAGIEEQHTIFALFPEFATLHKTSVAQGRPPAGVKFRLLSSSGAPAEGRPRGELHFAQAADGKRLFYRVRRGTGDKAFQDQGEVKLGQEIVTGWMDLRFRVGEFFPTAVEEEVPLYVERIAGSDGGLYSGVHLRLEDIGGAGDGKPQAVSRDDGFWLMEGASRRVTVGGRELTVMFAKRRIGLPFSLQLEKFTMGTDPGTRKAATYESQVTVKDSSATGAPKALISMNEPLEYGGYTFYQASYSLEEGRPPVSVFSVNRDPGRIVKYLGSLIMVLGICLMFYMNPHYWDKVFPTRKTEGATP